MHDSDSRWRKKNPRPPSITRTAALVAAFCSALACVLLIVDIHSHAYTIEEVRRSIVPCPPPPL